MIYDEIANIDKYLGRSVNLDCAIKYILKHDLSVLPYGKTDIDGDLVFVNVVDLMTDKETSKLYEVHRKYMDIHVNITGREIIQISFHGKKKLETDIINDCEIWECEKTVSCLIEERCFLICDCNEPHMPGVAIADNMAVKKAIFKVKL